MVLCICIILSRVHPGYIEYENQSFIFLAFILLNFLEASDSGKEEREGREGSGNSHNQAHKPNLNLISKRPKIIDPLEDVSQKS